MFNTLYYYLFILLSFPVFVSPGLNAADTLILKSNFLPQDDTVIIFSPANQTDNNKMPLLFLLHGHSANYASWNKICNLQKYSDITGFIIVCPDGLYDSYYLDSPLDSNLRYKQFFIQVLMPGIFDSYLIDTSNVFISGYSMGGHGALTLFFQYPFLFKAAGSISGVLDLSLSSNKNGILLKHFGEYKKNINEFNKHSAYFIIDSVYSSVFNKEIILHCGTGDPFFNINKLFAGKCESYNLKIIYNFQKGKHNNNYWAKAFKSEIYLFKELCNE